MNSPQNFHISYNREAEILKILWNDTDPSFIVCPNDNRQIARTILNNFTQQWSSSYLNNLNLSNLSEKNAENIVTFLSNHLPTSLEFTMAGAELVELLKHL